MIDTDRPAPPARMPRTEWFAPAVIAGSLVLHAAVVASLFWSPHAQAARPPAETPVEVVQQMPEPPKPSPKAAEQQKPPPAPKQAKAEPKQAKAEPKQVKAEPKPPAAKPASQKAAAQKPAAPSKTAAKQPPAPAKPQGAKAQESAQQRQMAAQDDVAERMQKLIGPMPAYALPSLGGGDSALDDSVSYKQIVLGRVAAQKREGRHEGVPGHVIVAFAIGDHGEVLSCEIREKSADPNLDAEAVAMVQRAAPYPPPPPGAPREFTFGLRFQIL